MGNLMATSKASVAPLSCSGPTTRFIGSTAKRSQAKIAARAQAHRHTSPWSLATLDKRCAATMKSQIGSTAAQLKRSHVQYSALSALVPATDAPIACLSFSAIKRMHNCLASHRHGFSTRTQSFSYMMCWPRCCPIRGFTISANPKMQKCQIVEDQPGCCTCVSHAPQPGPQNPTAKY